MVLGVNGCNGGSSNGNSNSNRGGQDNRGGSHRVVRLVANHNTSHDSIRRLIQEALDPLVVDPVPHSVLIHNIVITREPSGRLAISCEVAFEAAHIARET